MSTSHAMQHNSDFEHTIYLTDTALKRLQYLKTKEHENSDFYIKVSVLSGGCSGFQYKFEFINSVNSTDIVFKHEDIKVVTDETSFQLIKNITIDYVQELIGAAFTLKNPNADGSCGCGNSFSI